MKKHLLHIFSVVICSIISLNIYSANNNEIVTPDFAFPLTVNKNATAELNLALKQRNDPKAMRALLDKCLAMVAVDRDSVSSVLNLVSRTRSKLSSSQAISLTYILEANIINDFYQNEKYKYDRRETPLYPIPQDIEQWSGEQFRHTIDSLSNLSLFSSSLKNTPITEYKDVLTLNSQNTIFFPTLYDFVAHCVISIKSNISQFSSIPITVLTPRYFYSFNQSELPITDKNTKEILDIYQQLIALHSQNSAPLIYDEIDRLKFIKSHVEYSDSTNSHCTTLLLDLYNEYKDKTQYSSMILKALSIDRATSVLSDKQYYHLLTENIKKYPNYFQDDCLENIIANLTQPKISYFSNNSIGKGDSIAIKISLSNVNDFTINVYDVNNNTEGRVLLSKLKNRYTSKKIHIDGNIPFENDTVIFVPINEYGRYAINCETPSIKLSGSQYLPVFCCSDISTSVIDFTTTQIIAVNSYTGKPIDNAIIKNNSYKNGTRISSVVEGKTSSQGFYTFPKTNKNEFYRLSVSKGDDKFGFEKNTNIYNFNQNDTIYSVNGYTDRSIYHPGDTVKWIGVVYNSSHHGANAISARTLKVRMYNANNIVISDTTIVTDDFGRIHGQHKIPTGDLTGYYRIAISDESTHTGRRSIRSNIPFMVSDYKLPTYNIEIEEPYRDTPTDGFTTITGKLTTYSGMPVQNATIDLIIKKSIRSWWSTNYTPTYSTATTTDSSGRFEVTINNSSLQKTSDDNQYIYNVEINATSTSGESQSASKYFTISSAYMIGASIPRCNNLTESNPQLKISVLDGKNQEVSATVKIQFYNLDGTEIYQLTTLSNTPVINWDSIPSGQYKIVISTIEYEAEPYTLSDIVFYRLTDKSIPTNEVLWSAHADGSPIIVQGTTTNLIYGVLHPDMYVLVTISDPIKSEIISQKWIRPDTGIQQMPVVLPKDCNELNILFSTTYQYKSYSKTIVIKRSDDNKLQIIRESFRDRLIPGGYETWKFRTVTGTKQCPTPTAFIIDMYNTALDALLPYNFSFSIAKPYVRSLGYYSNDLFDISFRSSQPLSYKTCFEIPVVNFYTYDRSFIGNRRFVEFGSQKLMATSARGADNGVLESVESDQNELVNESTATGTTLEKNSDSGNIAKNNDLRTISTPVALWRPMLSTDKNGNLELSFTVPNVNTTWKLNMLAYTPTMNYTIETIELIANKPIMVQPNQPRFLRSGDRAQISSTVFNNSATQHNVSVVCEIFNPLTGENISTHKYSKTIPANFSDTISTIVDAPAELSMIAYRIKASTGDFTDGEQSVIPILPASQPVIESHTFYLNESDSIFHVELPAMKDSKVTLQYCDNPVWYLVTALPGLSYQNPATAPQAADAIFSAAIARKLIKQYPQITEALRYWKNSNQSDSTLKSMLEKNEELKILLLQSTPWISDAQSDTQRMQRLTLLLDSGQIDKTIQSSITTLSKLMRNNMAWAWMDQCDEPSRWATYYTLYTLGRVNALESLPTDKNLNKMISQSLKWYRGQLDQDYIKNHNNYSQSYVVISDLWPQYTPTKTGSEIINKVISDINNNWKKSPIYNLPTDALILDKHNRQDTAIDILKSLREYSKTTPQYGTWWPKIGETFGGTMTQLDVTADAMLAYHTIEPQSNLTNSIAQWLILQKEARNWGNSATATNIIYSILNSTPKWINSSHKTEIKVNGSPFNISYTDSILSSIKTPLIVNQNTTNDITIIRDGSSTPAWGAVYTQYTADMDHIKAVKNDAVSIDKQTFILKGDKWINSTEFKVGDRVRVQLTIKANRDIQYVTIDDNRAACFEPTEQLPRPIYSEGIRFYRENLDSATRMFVTNLPKGTYLLTYELWVNNSGEYSSGIATLQSQYAPQITAHSSGCKINVQ